MISRLFNIPKLTDHPVMAQYDYSEKFYGKFHYHEEIQITYIKQGEGILLCGSSSTPYEKGDLIILGSGLPHVFIGDEGKLSESISIYFKKEWLKGIYPESPYFQHFFKMSKQGLKIRNWSAIKCIEDILNKGGLYRITSLFDLFQLMSEAKNEKVLINDDATLEVKNVADNSKLNDVLKYISDHLHTSITLAELADLTNLTPPSFSRYFKQKTGRSVSNYIMNLRIEQAAKLLMNEDLNIEEIGYKSGYNNFSNFLRQFKKIKGMTPKEFREENLKKLIF